MPELGDRPMLLRRRGSDARVLWDTIHGRYHLPPGDLASADARLIIDLGSNIGLTMAHLATRFTRARVLGVEPDPGSASLARNNIEPWRDRCELVEAAIWPTDGAVNLATREGSEWAAHVGPAAGATVEAISLDSLLAQTAPDRVDYMKVDIEGAERDVLRAGGDWPRRVERLKVEVHPPYTVTECAEDLQAIGYEPTIDERHWACVVGRRTQASAAR